MCMCMCTHMGTKTISIMEDAYEILEKKKQGNESFSQVIRRLARGEDVMQFAGSWKKVSAKELDYMKRDIQKWRRASTEQLRVSTQEHDRS